MNNTLENKKGFGNIPISKRLKNLINERNNNTLLSSTNLEVDEKIRQIIEKYDSDKKLKKAITKTTTKTSTNTTTKTRKKAKSSTRPQIKIRQKPNN